MPSKGPKVLSEPIENIIIGHDFDEYDLYFDLHSIAALYQFHNEITDLLQDTVKLDEPFETTKERFSNKLIARLAYIDNTDDEAHFELDYLEYVGPRTHRYDYTCNQLPNPGDLVVITSAQDKYVGHLIDITDTSFVIELLDTKYLHTCDRANTTITKKKKEV